MGNLVDAKEQFNSVLAKFPKNFNALIGLADTELSLGSFEEAERLFLEAIKIDPNNWWGQRALAYYYARVGKYKEAEVYYRKLISLTPYNSLGYYNLSGTLYLQEKNEEAIAILKQGVDKAPSSKIYSNLGTIQFYSQQYEESIESFSRAVKLRPSNYLFWANLGDSYFWGKPNSGQHSEAYARSINLLDNLLELKDDYDLSLFLALILAKNGDLKRSSKILEKLIPARLPEQHYEKAFAFELIGNRIKALEEMGHALKGNYPLDGVTSEPFLIELTQDPRFILMVEQIKKSSQIGLDSQ